MTPDLTIQRLQPSYGIITTKKRGLNEIFYSIELEWNDNEQDISCIPKGWYYYNQIYSNTFKCDVLLLKNVVNRSYIELHPANYVRQLRGCIAPGLSMADIDQDGKIDVTNSRKALKRILELIPKKGVIQIK